MSIHWTCELRSIILGTLSISQISDAPINRSFVRDSDQAMASCAWFCCNRSKSDSSLQVCNGLARTELLKARSHNEHILEAWDV